MRPIRWKHPVSKANTPAVGARLLRNSVIGVQKRRVAEAAKAAVNFRAKVDRRLN